MANTPKSDYCNFAYHSANPKNVFLLSLFLLFLSSFPLKVCVFQEAINHVLNPLQGKLKHSSKIKNPINSINPFIPIY